MTHPHPSTAASYAAHEALATQTFGRSGRFPDCVTARVKVKAPVGYAVRGRLLHSVQSPLACSVWSSRLPLPRVAVRWSCGNVSTNAFFGTPPDEDLDLCAACDFAGVQGAGRVVYFAERDGLIKIGCSSNALARIASMGAKLLAVQPGGFATEAAMHDRFRTSRVKPREEWFRPTPDLRAYIADLLAERAA